MYSVFCVVPCDGVTCTVYNHIFYSVFLNETSLLCCTDLENRPWNTWLTLKLFSGYQWKGSYKTFFTNKGDGIKVGIG